LGGDEFVVILDALSNDAELATEQAHTIAEKISISLAHPYRLESYTHHGSASIGVALFSKGEVNSEELIKRADTAMYEAKRAGRNTVRFYDQAVQKNLEARGNLEHALHSAVSENQLELYYQLQVDKNKNPIGAEGLLRWHQPELGLLQPSDFITLAEESDLILPIGAWVLRTACAQLKHWEASEATRDLVLSVNISAVQLRKSNHSLEQQNFGSTRKLIKPNLVEQIQNVLESSEINPARLKLEITESLALHDIDFTIETLLHLKALGISIAMDDFGTGHSSLAHLKRMPLDQIKIDQSFVRDIVSDNYDQAIVKSMVDMANNIGISIIAEGVENQAQLDVLLNQGCDLFQGFLFGEALPIDEFEQGLVKHGKGEE
jgi:predicted signal transduction protein with EAL and GGDEF domain